MFVLHNIIQVKVIGAVCTNKHVGLRMYIDDCERTATMLVSRARSLTPGGEWVWLARLLQCRVRSILAYF